MGVTGKISLYRTMRINYARHTLCNLHILFLINVLKLIEGSGCFSVISINSFSDEREALYKYYPDICVKLFLKAWLTIGDFPFATILYTLRMPKNDQPAHTSFFQMEYLQKNDLSP